MYRQNTVFPQKTGHVFVPFRSAHDVFGRVGTFLPFFNGRMTVWHNSLAQLDFGLFSATHFDAKRRSVALVKQNVVVGAF